MKVKTQVEAVQYCKDIARARSTLTCPIQMSECIVGDCAWWVPFTIQKSFFGNRFIVKGGYCRVMDRFRL